MTGYQEIVSDPSYAGQIITFTNPHIGNYGVNRRDFESRRLFCRGVVVRDLARRPSNRRAEGDFDTMLRRYGVPGITGIDTRRLTRLIRDTGALPGAFGPAGDIDAVGRAAAAEPGTDGLDLVATVTPSAVHAWAPLPRTGGASSPTTTASSARSCVDLAELGTVEVVPAATPAADALALEPDGIFLSNGPGDPALRRRRRRHHRRAARHRRADLRHLPRPPAARRRPSARATVKLPFGHHGANHPVRDLTTGAIEITSQNHNFAVAPDGLGGVADDDPRQPQRRRLRGAAGHRRQRLLGAAPSRGRSRPARQPLPVRALRRADGRRAQPIARASPCSPAASGAPEPSGLPAPALGLA